MSQVSRRDGEQLPAMPIKYVTSITSFTSSMANSIDTMIQSSINYTRPLHDHIFLIIVDAFLKWLEIVPVKNATSSIIVDKVRGIWSTNGLPDTILIVTNNAAVFTSTLMEIFSYNGIKHIILGSLLLSKQWPCWEGYANIQMWIKETERMFIRHMN